MDYDSEIKKLNEQRNKFLAEALAEDEKAKGGFTMEQFWAWTNYDNTNAKIADLLAKKHCSPVTKS